MLSREARESALAPVSRLVNASMPTGSSHTIPIKRFIWDIYANQLVMNIRAFSIDLQSMPDSESGYGSLRNWSGGVAELFATIRGMFATLQPFKPFDDEMGAALHGTMANALSECLRETADPAKLEIELARLEELTSRWLKSSWLDEDSPLQAVFDLRREPRDRRLDFQPSFVFDEYRYANAALFEQIAPHLKSLRVPLISDLLVCVSIIGWITDAEDPIVAYLAFQDTLRGFASVKNAALKGQALDYIRGQEVTMRQTRNRVQQLLLEIESGDQESSAQALADAYRRIAEGSVRQYGWTLACLQSGRWSTPPTLTPVRERMIAVGGLLGTIAESCALIEMRNGEAHATLEWDGISQSFRVGDSVIDARSVKNAVVLGRSFDRGCAAAIACVRAVGSATESAVPSSLDNHRMPAWHRAESYFGTNGLRLVAADFNRQVARVTLASLHIDDVNPCFQALMVMRQLLPDPVAVEVFIEGDSTPAISIQVAALDATNLVWEYALEWFVTMPFSTFLPANYSARQEREAPSKAMRSICWIAADDLLDAVATCELVDGRLTLASATFLEKRFELVELALAQVGTLAPVARQARMSSLQEALALLRSDLAGWRDSSIFDRAMVASAGISRVRDLWSAWAPVELFPGVANESGRRDAWSSRIRTDDDRRRTSSF